MTEGSSSSPRINRLSRQLASQIAAGEVIERPASIVKELLENALDAGATEIELQLEEGGMRKILVRDNGHGVHADDMPLVLASHTTSKLHQASDLAAISSLGFRGEALASITSVAQINFISRQRDDRHAWQVGNDEQGKTTIPRPASHPVGTSVLVQDLFNTVPARRKFLRSAKTEFIHVQDLVKRIALSRPMVGMTLKHNGRRILRYKAGRDPQTALQERVHQVCGDGFMESALPFDREQSGIHVYGWSGLPGYARARADVQYVFLNGRHIKDRVVSHALRTLYEGQVDAGRYPAWVVYIEMEPSQVDVNVHPTKHEVRFREPRLVHDCLHIVIGNEAGLLNAAVADDSGRQSVSYLQPSVQDVRETAASYAGLSSTPGCRPQGPVPPVPQATMSERQAVVETDNGAAITVNAIQRLYDDYLLVKATDDYLLLDLAAASALLVTERLLQEQWRGGIVSRPLLVPVSLPLPMTEQQFEALQSHINSLGFDIGLSAPGTVMLRAMPVLFSSSDPTRLGTELLACLQQENDMPLDSMLAHLAHLARPLPDDCQQAACLEKFLQQLSPYMAQLLAQDIARPLTREQLDVFFRH